MKYRKRGVKRQHNIVEDLLSTLEEISKIDGVKSVIPAKIMYSPSRGITKKLKIQRDTITGFKLHAHHKGSIQEIFVVVEPTKKQEVRKSLMSISQTKQ